MKYIKISSSLLLASALMTLSSCNDNDWNNRLDGFEVPSITDVQTVKYTLTDADYGTIAGLADNKALAGEELANELKAIGTQHYFTPEIPAANYIPAFLTNSNFPYFTLTDGSSIQITYNVAENMPEEIVGIGSAYQYTVSDADYQDVWGSDTDYTPSFAPKHTAAASLPAILRENFDDAETGDYVIVNYNTSNINPTFGSTTATPDEPGKFTLSNVVSTLKSGDSVDINGVVTAVCNAGFILTDASGSVFVYMGGSYDSSTYPVGSQLVVNAVIGSYNKGIQVTGSSSTFTVKGSESTIVYPTPKVFTAEDFKTAVSRTTDEIAVYGQMTGKIVISGTNINIDMGSEDVMGGIYYATDEIKSQLQEGETMTVTGYFIAIAASRYCNFVVTKVEAGAKEMPRRGQRRVVEVPSTNENAVYMYNGSNWVVPANTLVLNPADYTAMGQKYGNLEQPDAYLPTYLRIKLPYAQAEDSYFIVYKYYSGGTTSYKCDQYTFNGSEWTKFNGYVESTSQFVKVNGKWMFDPNVTITLPAGKGIEISQLYFQACTDYVYENIDRPLGSTSITSGAGYVTSYGNNEYYSGASAYQGNVDNRPASARAQYAAGYEGMTDEEVADLMKQRFLHEVFPAALSKIHSDAKPMEGLDIIYTINFSVYNGKTTAYTVKYKVVGPAEFEFIECDW